MQHANLFFRIYPYIVTIQWSARKKITCPERSPGSLLSPFWKVITPHRGRQQTIPQTHRKRRITNLKRRCSIALQLAFAKWPRIRETIRSSAPWRAWFTGFLSNSPDFRFGQLLHCFHEIRTPRENSAVSLYRAPLEFVTFWQNGSNGAAFRTPFRAGYSFSLSIAEL